MDETEKSIDSPVVQESLFNSPKGKLRMAVNEGTKIYSSSNSCPVDLDLDKSFLLPDINL